jgi:predicted nicotinamide N-methyase
MLDREVPCVDVVLMLDIFYDPDEMPAMVATLRRLWRDGTVCWAASEVRCGVQDCVDVPREEGFDLAEVDRVTRPLLRAPSQNADFAVYRIEFRRSREG